MRTMNVLKKIKINELYQTFEDQQRAKQEVEACVTSVRLELYNRDLPWAAKAVQDRLSTFYHVKPRSSERTIARILVRQGLTHGRTGFYS